MQKSMKISLKKMKVRQLTKNEKVLFTLLGIVIVFWLSYRFIYISQSERLQALQLKRLEYEVVIEDINSTLRQEKAINSEWQELNREKNRIVSTYFPTLDQPQIIYLLNELMASEDVHIQDFNFSRPSMTEFEDFQVNSMDISIPYSGNYKGIMELLDSIKGSPRKITVDSLSMDANATNNLIGDMVLRVYSLDGIAESNPDIIYIDTALNEKKENPFMAYKEPESVISENGLNGNGTGEAIDDGSISQGESGYQGQISGEEKTNEKDSHNEKKPYNKINPYIEDILLDFETKNNFFLPSQQLVKGDVSLSTNSKSKKHSLRLEYNIVAIGEENRAFIDVTRNNIKLKYPPSSIGIWVYSYDYLPVTLGIRFIGQMGEEVLVPLSEGIGWTGWKHIEVSGPSELGLYPMNLENIYLEVPDGRDSYGIILIDKLQAIYPRNLDQDGNDSSIGDYMFHVVNRGDTIERISERYYGSRIYKNEIVKLNELKSGGILPIGKVLVLKKR